MVRELSPFTTEISWKKYFEDRAKKEGICKECKKKGEICKDTLLCEPCFLKKVSYSIEKAIPLPIYFPEPNPKSSVGQLRLGTQEDKETKRLVSFQVSNPIKERMTLTSYSLFHQFLNLIDAESITAKKIRNILNKHHLEKKELNEKEIEFIINVLRDSLILNIVTFRHVINLEGIFRFFGAKEKYKLIDLHILDILYKSGKITPSQLLKKTKIRKNNFFESIKKLIKQGLIKEEPKDKRGNYIHANEDDFKRKFCGLLLKDIKLFMKEKYNGIFLDQGEKIETNKMKEMFEVGFRPFSIETGKFKIKSKKKP